ncbi:Uncharacterized conserved protein YndB, AHSA1/START domain [Raineyella antarctica]|uniref:Uncharacterized conserved protein YndB, AHSA1/START domain n=1 Tax=Raineyella antarctica TaxID=1577474 RepID=A0A1G6HDZ5_9ACTN|nr:SRPBCC domain-containing protein [Raineyella antarctica]SDB92502.1 Uncharacterized conserved protein YndB, AHSA1/START domain [Raineyella antarctica]
MAEPARLVEVRGRTAVRFVRRHPQPVTRVWDAVTAPEELARWFPSPEVTYLPQVGARIVFAGDPNLPASVGTVLAWEPERLFALGWGGDELWIEVGPDGEDTVLSLTDVLDSADAAARNAAGWEVCLRALDRALEDLAGHVPPDGSDLSWYESYQRYIDAGFPSGATVPGL